MQNFQANMTEIFTKFFWRAGKLTIGSVDWVMFSWQMVCKKVDEWWEVGRLLSPRNEPLAIWKCPSKD